MKICILNLLKSLGATWLLRNKCQAYTRLRDTNVAYGHTSSIGTNDPHEQVALAHSPTAHHGHDTTQIGPVTAATKLAQATIAHSANAVYEHATAHSANAAYEHAIAHSANTAYENEIAYNADVAYEHVPSCLLLDAAYAHVSVTKTTGQPASVPNHGLNEPATDTNDDLEGRICKKIRVQRV